MNIVPFELYRENLREKMFFGAREKETSIAMSHGLTWQEANGIIQHLMLWHEDKDWHNSLSKLSDYYNTDVATLKNLLAEWDLH